MLVAALGFALVSQQPPLRVVVMDAQLEGKPYGKVTYMRGLVAGKGFERTVTLDTREDDIPYSVSEKRTYTSEGAPIATVRTVVQGDQKITITVTYTGLKASVSVSQGGEVESDEYVLDEEGATTRDVSQAWFFGSPPEKNAKARFWEFSLDENDWVLREVTYAGTADVKVGDKTVKGAHRISIGKFVNFYVDEFGMPFRSIQETDKGTLNLLRTDPPIKEIP